MNEQTNTPPTTGKVRNRALLGTAVAVLLGGAIAGEAILLPKTMAYADPVRVEGVQPVSFADVVEKVRPAVVSVRVKGPAREMAGFDGQDFEFPKGSPMEKFFKQFRENGPDRQQRPFSTSLGSGFLISDDGYVVTNDHVVDEGQSMTIILDDGTEYVADVVGLDEKTDLALLKIKNPDREFTYVKFSEERARIGDWVVAVGNPFGLGGTVTAGIISADGRNIGAGPYDDFIQIDAAVNRGNSGGPAFNLNGEVIGVNTAIFSPSGGNVGIAFAIPASTAERIIDDLTDDGKVVRGWLGVQIQGIDRDIADGLQLADAKGSLVTEAQAGSPAAAAGLKSGDAILAVNGEDLEDPKALATKIASMAPGEMVKVSVWRSGKAEEIDVTLGTLPGEEQLASLSPEEAPEVSPLADFGLVVAEGDEGVTVEDVDPNGQAAERGLQPGDIILAVGKSDVAKPADVEKLVKDAETDGRKAVLLRVKSGEQTRFVALTFVRT
ncbi:Do family serine endopeptidase [Bauldia litoralis]|uniref:Do family serine endopeptidase n=1 Tax=Bauldia litoralis TaxID=665467 RepID=UPI003264EF9B